VYQVCKGESVEACPVYDPSTEGPHWIAYYVLGTNKRELLANCYEEGGHARGYEKAELALCTQKIDESFSHECYYEGANVVKHYDATYELKLYVVHTGELLDETIRRAHESECPPMITEEKGTKDTTFKHVTTLNPEQIESFVEKYVYPLKHRSSGQTQ
jgi:hypothetical protein